METATARPYAETVSSFAQELEASRCDRCSAQARVLLGLHAGRLTFCGHHWNRYEDTLIKLGVRVLASSLDQLLTS